MNTNSPQLAEQNPLRGLRQDRQGHQRSSGQGLLGNDQRAAIAASRLATLVAENRVSEARLLLRSFVSQGIESAAIWRLARVLEPPVAKREAISSAPLPSGRIRGKAEFAGRWLALRGSEVVATSTRIEDLEQQVAGVPDRKDLAFFWATK